MTAVGAYKAKFDYQTHFLGTKAAALFPPISMRIIVILWDMMHVSSFCTD